MSSKKPNSLRNALREIRVNQPNRLSKGGPSFRPPEFGSENGKEVPPFEAPLSNQPLNELSQSMVAQSELPQDEIAHSKAAHNEAPGSKEPQLEERQIEPTQYEGARKEVTQIERPTNGEPYDKQPQREAPRIEDAQNERPQKETPKSKPAQKKAPRNEAGTAVEDAQNDVAQIEQPSKGFFRLSDRTFAYAQLQKLSGDGFRLFLWMSSKAWRYQNSDGTLRASVGFIEIHTGMSHATISRCLKTLREESLIVLRETDYKRGNLWYVSPIAFAGCSPEDLPPRSQEPQNGGPRKETAATSKRDRSSINLSEKPPQNEQQNRNIYKHKKLSQEGAQVLLDRIEKIRAPEKQRTEKESLLRLLDTHTPEEVNAALLHVDRHGTLAGEACHSPLRYLTTAIDDVLRICQKSATILTLEVANSASSNSTKPICEEKPDEERNLAAYTAFQSELTQNERTQLVSAFVAKEFTFGYTPSDSLATRLTAMNWYQSRQPSQQAAG